MKLIFYSPSHFEPWSWQNPDTVGIGGSETSHIEMATRLARRGHEVISYSPLPTDCPDRHHGGVRWRDLSECTFADPGTWLLYRCPEAVDRFDRLRTDQRRWLICQDEDYPAWMPHVVGETLAHNRQDGIHRVVALCQAQAEQFRARWPRLRNKVSQSSNGIKGELVDQILARANLRARNPRRILFASSPDRGLSPVLWIFERAREAVPDLELYVAYGFDNIDKIAARIEAQPEAERTAGDARWLKWLAGLKQQLQMPGVTVTGRLPQPRLYELWATCGLWVCCTRFRETSCITSMEAQSLGGIPIVLPLWAVGENVRHGAAIHDVLPCTPGTSQAPVNESLLVCRFALEVERWALDPVAQERERAQMMPWARERFDWNNFVAQWEKWLQKEATS